MPPKPLNPKPATLLEEVADTLSRGFGEAKLHVTLASGV